MLHFPSRDFSLIIISTLSFHGSLALSGIIIRTLDIMFSCSMALKSYCVVYLSHFSR